MCIIYFANHTGCDHKHFLGTYHCAPIQCPFEKQHKYDIEDSGYGCDTCATIDDIALDPDDVPVEQYPPVKDPEIEVQHRNGLDRIVPVPPLDYQPSPASLSDVDSITSHWRLDERDTTPDINIATPTPSPQPQDPNDPAATPIPTPYKPSPGTAQHRQLIQEQLEAMSIAMPPPDETPSKDPKPPVGPSQAVLQHRELVKQQLKQLQKDRVARNHVDTVQAAQWPVDPYHLHYGNVAVFRDPGSGAFVYYYPGEHGGVVPHWVWHGR